MPELPEVETIAQDLNKSLVGLSVKEIKILGGHKVVKTPLVSLRKILYKKKLKRVFRRAKMVVFDFDKHYLLVHLKMTGQLIYLGGRSLAAGGHPIISTGVQVPNKHTVLEITLNKGKLYFNDVRKFGWLKLLDKNEFIELDKRTGQEPLEQGFTLSFFAAILKRRAGLNIKAALLEQKHFVGIGNIYADEILFKAKVKPARKVASLTKEEIKKIYQATVYILRLSIKHRGTTFRDYTDAAGLKGKFINYLKVYGRSGLECRQCSAKILKDKVAGRGTHWCDNCQK